MISSANPFSYNGGPYFASKMTNPTDFDSNCKGCTLLSLKSALQ